MAKTEKEVEFQESRIPTLIFESGRLLALAETKPTGLEEAEYNTQRSIALALIAIATRLELGIVIKDG